MAVVGVGVAGASNTIADPVPMMAATAIRRPSTLPTEFETLVQLADVAEVQLVVKHDVIAIQTVADGSERPICRPEIVTHPAPELGTFAGHASDTTGASKLRLDIIVPTSPLTLTAVRLPDPDSVAPAQPTLVDDVQAVLAHAPSASKDAVPLAIDEPKLSPLIVTLDSPPLCTTFAPTLSHDTTGASKLKNPVAVPATRLTVTAVTATTPRKLAGVHATEVPDVQLVLLHMLLVSTDAVGVFRYARAKLSPLSVKDWEPLMTRFSVTAAAKLTDGAADDLVTWWD